MPFPETLLLDNFDRANQGPPPSSSWTTLTLETGGLVVSSNQVTASVAGGNGAAYWNASDFGPDCESYVSLPTVGGSNYAYVCARLVNIGVGTTDGYAFEWRFNNTVLFYRLDNEVFTALGATFTLAGTPTGIGLAMQGTVLRGHTFDGSSWLEVYQAEDVTYTSTGKVGFAIGDLTGIGSISADDFGGGTTLDTGSERSGGNVTVGP